MLSERVMMVLLAFALWYTLYPSLETAQTWGFAWMLYTWAVNMGLVFLVAGGFHWFFVHEKRLGPAPALQPSAFNASKS